MSNVKITRRGFRGKYAPPANVVAEAERIIAEHVADGATTILVSIRSASYCGPRSAGDQGAYTFDLMGTRSGKHVHDLRFIARNV